MDPLLSELEFHPDSDSMAVVLDPPAELDDVWAAWQGHAVDVAFEVLPAMSFVLAFVPAVHDIAARADQVLGNLSGDDPRLWFAYREKDATSFADSGPAWQALVDRGYQPVRHVTVDDNWSALRFRLAPDGPPATGA